eukprot:COSAG04_NODE_1870_length_5345_cov_9.554878_7_plen_74_part_00
MRTALFLRREVRAIFRHSSYASFDSVHSPHSTVSPLATASGSSNRSPAQNPPNYSPKTARMWAQVLPKFEEKI